MIATVKDIEGKAGREAVASTAAAIALFVVYYVGGGIAADCARAVVDVSSVGFTLIWDVFVSLVCALYLKRAGLCRKRAPALTSAGALGIVCAVACVCLAGNCAGTLIWSAGDASYASYTAGRAVSSQAAQLLLSCAVAPLCEELLCRGCIYLSARRALKLGAIPAALISATVFALIHGTYVHLPMTFMCGLLMCGIVEAHDRLSLAVCAHGLLNAATMFVVPSLSVPMWLVSPPAVAVMCALVIASLLAWLRISEIACLDEVDAQARVDDVPAGDAD